ELCGHSRQSQLFDTIVVLEDADLNTVLHSECPEMNFSRYGFSRHLLALFGYLHPRVSLEISFDISRFDEVDVEKLAGRFRCALEGLAQEANTYLDDLILFSKEEWRQIITEWNQTATVYREEKCLHELVQEQAE